MSTPDQSKSVHRPADNLDYQEPYDVSQIHNSVLREKTEPRDGLQPVSLWVVGLCFVTLFCGGAYLLKYSGGFQADVFDETQVHYGPVESSGPHVVDPIKHGKKVYTQNCALCHQATGLGQPGQYPPLTGSEWVTGPQNRLISILLHGANGPLTVAGQTFNGAMPPQKDTLKDEDIAHVLTYIRQEWGNKASAVSTEAVAEMRKENAARTKPWTEAELKALPPKDFPAPGTAPAASASVPAPQSQAAAPAPAKH